MLIFGVSKAKVRHRNRDEFREKKQAERDQARPASFIGRKITDCENRAHVAGAIIQRDGSGQIVAGAAALADRLRPQDERQTETATIHGAEAFAARLDQAGIAIVRATDADVKIIDALRREEAAARLAAETNREAYKGNRFDRLQAGDVAAVNRRGDVFRLNPYRLDLERIERALTSSRTLPGVIEARAAFESNRAQTEKLWTRTKAASVERKAAFEQRRDVRSTVATAERAEHKTFAAPAHAIDSGLKKPGLFSASRPRLSRRSFRLLIGRAGRNRRGSRRTTRRARRAMSKLGTPKRSTKPHRRTKLRLTGSNSSRTARGNMTI